MKTHRSLKVSEGLCGDDEILRGRGRLIILSIPTTTADSRKCTPPPVKVNPRKCDPFCGPVPTNPTTGLALTLKTRQVTFNGCLAVAQVRTRALPARSSSLFNIGAGGRGEIEREKREKRRARERRGCAWGGGGQGPTKTVCGNFDPLLAP